MLQELDFFGNKKSVPGECGGSKTHQEIQDVKKEESLTEKREHNKKRRKMMTTG